MALALLPVDDPNLARMRAWYLSDQNSRSPEVEAIRQRAAQRGATYSPVTDPSLNDGVAYNDLLRLDLEAAIRARVDERDTDRAQPRAL